MAKLFIVPDPEFRLGADIAKFGGIRSVVHHGRTLLYLHAFGEGRGYWLIVGHKVDESARTEPRSRLDVDPIEEGERAKFEIEFRREFGELLGEFPNDPFVYFY